MLRVVLLFSLLSFAFAIHRTRCGLDTDNGTTFKPTKDGVEARYTLEWCSEIPEDATMWKLKLESIATKKCNKNISALAMYRLKKTQGTVHSVVTEPIEGNFGCNITCFSTALDLVFSGCYLSENQVFIGNLNQHIDREMLLVSNQFAGQAAFNNLTTYYTIEKDGDTLTVIWNLHYIPVSNYTVQISPYIKEIKTYVNWTPIHNCTHDTYSLTCRFPAPAPQRCVACALEHAAAWLSGPLFEDKPVMVYCSPPLSAVGVSAGAGAAWWAGGGACALLLLLAALWAGHARLLRGLHKRTIRDWTQRYAEYKAARDVKLEEPGEILLLYAQDCAPAMEVVAVLRDMLEAGAPGKVVDLFSAEWAARGGAAPLEWVRGLVARRGARVVLLQTPAAAALYNTPLDNNLCLQEPLLGRVVQYRSPHYADALLHYALRIIRDTAHEQAEYTKYYIVSVSALEAELVPRVAALRRYLLPAHGAALLRDLRLRREPGREPALSAACARLVRFVREHPDYLKDELDYLQPTGIHVST